jgi:hypothetical protein
MAWVEAAGQSRIAPSAPEPAVSIKETSGGVMPPVLMERAVYMLASRI